MSLLFVCFFYWNNTQNFFLYFVEISVFLVNKLTFVRALDFNLKMCYYNNVESLDFLGDKGV